MHDQYEIHRRYRHPLKMSEEIDTDPAWARLWTAPRGPRELMSGTWRARWTSMDAALSSATSRASRSVRRTAP